MMCINDHGSNLYIGDKFSSLGYVATENAMETMPLHIAQTCLFFMRKLFSHPLVPTKQFGMN